MELPQIPQLLNETLSPDGSVVRAATESLDRLSLHPDFPFYLLSITTGRQLISSHLSGVLLLSALDFVIPNLLIG